MKSRYWLLAWLVGVAVIASLASPAYTVKPSPSPSPSPSAWQGRGTLTIEDRDYDFRHDPAGCRFTRIDDDSADWDCYAWKEGQGTDWTHPVGEGLVAGDFKHGPGTDYLWAVWDKFTDETKKNVEIVGLRAEPYEDPFGGGGGPSGGGGSVCNSGNTTVAQRNAIAGDYCFHSYPSCPQQSYNVGQCPVINGNHCYCVDAVGTFNQYEGGPVKPGTSCRALHPVEVYPGGACVKR